MLSLNHRVTTDRATQPQAREDETEKGVASEKRIVKTEELMREGANVERALTERSWAPVSRAGSVGGSCARQTSPVGRTALA